MVPGEFAGEVVPTELLPPARPGRRGRLAGVAASTFAVAAVFVVYALACNCS